MNLKVQVRARKMVISITELDSCLQKRFYMELNAIKLPKKPISIQILNTLFFVQLG